LHEVDAAQKGDLAHHSRRGLIPAKDLTEKKMATATAELRTGGSNAGLAMTLAIRI
jgi:hypothetical protein